MRKYLLLLLAATLLACVGVHSADKSESAAKYEYAIVKWDGPDRLYYNMLTTCPTNSSSCTCAVNG